MGLGTGAQVQAWEEVRKLPKDQSSAVEDEGSSFWSWFGCASCFASGPRVESTAIGSPSTGESHTDRSSFTVPPSEQTLKTDSSAKSDATDSSVASKTEEDLVLTSQLRRFSFNDLKAATRNFRPDSLLGEGGFGCVFKGWIDEHGTAPVKPGTGLTVAVKTLNRNGLQGHREWLAEITFLGQLHHPNLVNLIGFCMEDNQRLLVYEFMQRGSLENHLFRKGALPLPWNTRMKIALGAAKGVEFLHSGKKPVIYRDFKTSNILLDMGYMAKLSDFGLAKDGPQGGKSHVSTRIMGTLGYAAPEYVMTGHLTSKSDVYSFGVVLLEMLTGKRSLDKNRPNGEQNLTEWARPYLSDRRKVSKVIDPRLEGYYSVKGAQKAGHLAHRCLSRDPKARPSMCDIVEILEQLQNLSDMASTTHPPLVSMGAGTRTVPSASANASFRPTVKPDPSNFMNQKPVKASVR